MLPQQLGASGQNALAFDLCAYTPAGNHLKMIGFGQHHATFSAAAYNGLSERMLGKLLGRSGQPVSLAAISAI